MKFLPTWLIPLVIIAFLAIFCTELLTSVHQQSQTVDEAVHIFAGYRYWKAGDFGVNPEHPPLVKLLATLPLLGLHLQMPETLSGEFKEMEYNDGRDFLYRNNADQILLRSRLSVSIFSLILAILVFFAAKDMFGTGPALIALLIFIFEPTLLAHGALVTTDMGVTCCLFLAVYAFYRYVKSPSLARLLQMGIATGLALAAKHSGILIFPILFVLALIEVTTPWERHGSSETSENGTNKNHFSLLRMLGALIMVGVIAIALPWSLYGFRYKARPAGLALTPALSEVAGPQRHPAMSRVTLAIARYKLLPESYIYGFVDISRRSHSAPSFLLGKLYGRGQWFYFPAVLVIKSTLASLLLLALIFVAPSMRERAVRREVSFLVVPIALYTLVAMASGLNLGVRHMLPAYPYAIILMGATAWSLAAADHRWAYVIVLLLVFHMFSSLRAFPNYLAYSNELFGGPAGTYKVLTDSNVDWGQGLRALKAYTDRRHIRDCWLVYYGWVAAEPAYYGVPCRILPGGVQGISQPATEPVPATIRGPLFVSATEITGFLETDGESDPYAFLRKVRPSALIDDSILAYDGTFNMSVVAAQFKSPDVRAISVDAGK